MFRSHIDKRRAVGFVSFKPLERGLHPLISQSRNFFEMVVSCKNDSLMVSPTRLSGRWKKNGKLSDDTNVLYEYASLPWLLRKGERFLRYLEIESNETQFRRTINAGGFLNVSEIYPWDGSATKLKRRDMRGGTMEGWVEQTPAGARTMVAWTDPHGLSMEDRFCLSDDGNQLTIYTTARRPSHDDHVTIKQVFTKL